MLADGSNMLADALKTLADESRRLADAEKGVPPISEMAINGSNVCRLEFLL